MPHSVEELYWCLFSLSVYYTLLILYYTCSGVYLLYFFAQLQSGAKDQLSNNLP